MRNHKIVLSSLWTLLLMTCTAVAQSPHEMWSRHVKGWAGGGGNIAISKSGSEYVLAFSDSDTITIGKSTYFHGKGMAIIKYDTASNVLWSRILEGSAAYYYAAPNTNLLVDDSDNVYVGGTFWNKKIVIGTDTLLNLADSVSVNAFVAKFSATGVFRWATRIGNHNSAYFLDFGKDAHNNIYSVVGSAGDTLYVGHAAYYTTSGFGAALVRLNSNGAPLSCAAILPDGYWNIWYYSNPKGAVYRHMCVNKGGGVSICGMYLDSLYISDTLYVQPHNWYGFVAGFDTLGHRVWSHSLGWEVDFLQTDNNNLYVAGLSYDSIKVGKFNLKQKGSGNGFIAKYNEKGRGQWAVLMADSTGSTITGFKMGEDANLNVTGTIIARGAALIIDTVTLKPDTAHHKYAVYTAAIDTSHSAHWAAIAYGSNRSYASRICGDKQGRVTIAGMSGSFLTADSLFIGDTNHSGWDQYIFALQYNNNSRATWGSQIWANPYDTLTDMEITPGNNIYLEGGWTFIGAKDTLCIGKGDTIFEGPNAGSSLFLVRYGIHNPTFTQEPPEPDNDIVLYPNPAQQSLTIVSHALINHVDILDALGRNVRSVNTGGGKVNIDFSNLSEGMYCIRIYNGKNVTIRKAIKIYN